MDKEKAGLALVGFGYWGKNYLKTLKDMEGVDLRWVCDIQNLPKSFAFPSEKTTREYEKILNDKSVEGVIISTPTTTHYELARQAIEGGKDVLVEKPITSDSEEAKSLIELAEKLNRLLVPGHVFAHNPAVKELEKYISGGELGEIISMNALRLSLGPIRTNDNAMWDLMPHDISMFLRFKKKFPKTVNAFGGAFLGRSIADFVHLGMKYEDGSIATCQASWVYPRKTREVVVVGKKKMAVFDDVSNNKLAIYDSGIIDIDKVDLSDYARTAREGNMSIPKISGRSPLEVQCEDFIDCIKTRKEPRVSSLEGYNVVKILEYGQKSLQEKAEVEL